MFVFAGKILCKFTKKASPETKVSEAEVSHVTFFFVPVVPEELELTTQTPLHVGVNNNTKLGNIIKKSSRSGPSQRL